MLPRSFCLLSASARHALRRCLPLDTLSAQGPAATQPNEPQILPPADGAVVPPATPPRPSAAGRWALHSWDGLAQVLQLPA